jgi:ring-1,2-phenylacetyl-CoA epoxidase subunit PaaE
MPTFHSLRVAAIDPLTDDAVALTFEVPEELRDEYVFTAGQHLSIRGADEKRRSFSIFTPPSSGLLRVGIKVLPGGSFSEGVLGDLRVGDELDVMTPAGRFTVSPDADAKHRYVAIAAGSGITPVLSIITTLLEEEPASEVTLVYANRTHRTVMFLDEVHDLKDRHPDRFRLLHVLSREEQDAELLSGRLDARRADPAR